MMMKWPWQRGRGANGRLVVCALDETFAYAQADGSGRLRRCGLERRGEDSPADFARRVRALGLPPRQVCAVLPLAEGQLVQVEAPAVKPEEMKAAARWRVKDLVEGRLDELTIDVMFVGDDKPRPNRHVFVAAARSATINAVGDRTRAAGLDVSVIDLVETAQRNFQSSLAAAEGLAERATAALMSYGDQCLLTICAGSELYYTRRLEWEGLALIEAPLVTSSPAASLGDDGLFENVDFVDYGGGDASAEREGEAPRLVIELQRSFDLWERSWPDLPLATLWVQVGDDSQALATLLTNALGQRVEVLDPERVFPGLADAAASADVRTAVLPMLGALLRA